MFVVLHVGHDFVVCHLCQLSLFHPSSSDIPSTKIELTLDFPQGSVKHFITSSQQVVHMTSSHTSDSVLLDEDEGTRVQRTRCESMMQKVDNLVGQDSDDQIIGVWDREISWLRQIVGSRHHTLLKHHTWLLHRASRSPRFALSLSLSLSTSTMLLECW